VLLVSNSSSASSKKDALLDGKASEAMDHLTNKCKSLEDQLSKRDEELKEMQLKIEELSKHNYSVQELYENKLKEVMGERDFFAKESETREYDIGILKREKDEQIVKLKSEYESEIDKLKLENSGLVERLNIEMDKNLKIEETIDLKVERIQHLEKEMQR
jgi:hypothetical protein